MKGTIFILALCLFVPPVATAKELTVCMLNAAYRCISDPTSDSKAEAYHETKSEYCEHVAESECP